jgi:hypothetical protein
VCRAQRGCGGVAWREQVHAAQADAACGPVRVMRAAALHNKQAQDLLL